MTLVALVIAATLPAADIWSGDLDAGGLRAAVIDDFSQGLRGWQIAYTPEYYKGGFGAEGLRVEDDPQRGPVMVAPIAFRNTRASEVAFITKTLDQHPRILDVAAVRLWLRLDMKHGQGLDSFIVRLRTSPRRFIDLRLYPGHPLPTGRWQQMTVPVDLSHGRNVWGYVLDTVKWLTLRLDDIDDEPVVMEPEQWLRVSLPRWKADIRQMVRRVQHRRMQPFYTVIEPGGGTREDYSHHGEEFGLVLEGELTLKVGEETYRVRAGSSFYYPSSLPHSWTNEGKRPCRVVWVVTPPSW